jgi:hypothetical protein
MLDRFSYRARLGHVISLAGALNRQGIETVVAVTDCPAPERERCQKYCRQKAPFFAEDRTEQIVKIARHYQVKLIHVHALSLLPLAWQLSRQLRLPYGITVHEPPAAAANAALLAQALFIIVTSPALQAQLPRLKRAAAFIPEAVDLDEYRPQPRNDFRIAFLGDAGGYTADGYMALVKAAGIADLPLEVICPEPVPLVKGRFHGWTLDRAAVLSRTQVVAGSKRGLIEGMACGNAALLMGRSYHGIVQPQSFAAGAFPDLSGGGTVEPCYRSIFHDLAQLLKDRPYLTTLQHWGRKFTRENCDLRLAAEATARLYARSTTN